MRRSLAVGQCGALLAAIAWASASAGQEPSAIGPSASDPRGIEAPTPEPSPGVMAPRTDSYSTYTDAFYNANTLDPSAGSQSGTWMQRLFRGPKNLRVYGGADYLNWTRSDAQDRVLTKTTADIFQSNPTVQSYGNPQPVFNGETRGAPLYGVPVSYLNTINGVQTYLGPNDKVYSPYPNITGPVARRGMGIVVDQSGNYLGDIPENLVENQVRMSTNDFDIGNRPGVRTTIGIELWTGSKIEFSYFWINTFRPANLTEDVSGSAFLMKVITQGSDTEFTPQYQRFGYLTSPFTTLSPQFAGERRRQIGTEPSIVPNNAQNENPRVVPSGEDFTPTSRDVPREPTVNDRDRLSAVEGGSGEANGNPNNHNNRSFLWMDGELAHATYSFNIQGADLSYKRPIFTYHKKVWDLNLVASARYIQLNERFSFFFADVAGFPGSGIPVAPRSPFDRSLVNTGAVDPDAVDQLPSAGQPSNQTYATTTFNVDNNMIGPMLGIQARRPFFYLFEIDILGRMGWFANFQELRSSLIRGDGYVGYFNRKDITNTSGAFEGHLGLNFVPWQNLRIKAGWDWMWLLNVGTGPSNISYDLDQKRRPNAGDNVLFNGWYVGAEYMF